MPTYDFKCNDCDTHFEEKMAMSEVCEKKVKCPSCGLENTRRVLGVVSFSITRPLISQAKKSGLREDFYEKRIEERKEKKRASGDDSPLANEKVVNQALNDMIARGL